MCNDVLQEYSGICEIRRHVFRSSVYVSRFMDVACLHHVICWIAPEKLSSTSRSILLFDLLYV